MGFILFENQCELVDRLRPFSRNFRYVQEQRLRESDCSGRVNGGKDYLSTSNLKAYRDNFIY